MERPAGAPQAALGPPPPLLSSCSSPCGGGTCLDVRELFSCAQSAAAGCDCAGCCVEAPPSPPPPPLATVTFGLTLATSIEEVGDEGTAARDVPVRNGVGDLADACI